MNLALDPKLQELNRLIQIETDPQKLSELADAFNLRLNEIREEEERPTRHEAKLPHM